MGFFDKIEQAPADPILGLTAAFKEESRSEKVNLGVGAYKTDELTPLVLGAVRKAQEKILADALNKEYLPIDGDADYLKRLTELAFSEQAAGQSIYATQAPGGTGALRIGGEFLCKEITQNIYVSDPTWANHAAIFTSSGCQVKPYAYYDADTRSFNKAGMLEAIQNMTPKSAILLHARCHNPTGVDPSTEDWKEISDAVKERELLPFFDFAYQGFGTGLDEDAFAVRHFLAQGHVMLMAHSCSKNFGLYNERTGAFFVVTGDATTATAAGSQIKRIIRSNYSNPPANGARIVSIILGSDVLRQEWETELADMRGRILKIRKELAHKLNAAGSSVDFGFIENQYGMFSFSGLNSEQVAVLKKDHAIYMPSSGRINVAGLSSKNLDYVVKSILAVL